MGKTQSSTISFQFGNKHSIFEVFLTGRLFFQSFVGMDSGVASLFFILL